MRLIVLQRLELSPETVTTKNISLANSTFTFVGGGPEKLDKVLSYMSDS